MKVKNLLDQKDRDVITIIPEASLKESMKILIENRISCLPVVSNDMELIGIISDKDIFTSIYANVESMENDIVSSHMTQDIIVGIPDDDIDYIAGLMTNNKIRHIPIIDNKRIVGLISVGDIVKSQLVNKESENRYLKSYISGEYPG